MTKAPEKWKEEIQSTGFVDSENLQELEKVFRQLDVDGNGHVSSKEIGSLFKALGEDVPGYKLRDCISSIDKNKNGTIELNEFLEVYAQHQADSGKIWAQKLVKKLGKAEVVKNVGIQGAHHSYSEPEKVAFASWINENLRHDPDCAKYLLLNVDNDDLFRKMNDGVLLAKVVNLANPDHIDERVLNKKPKNEWHQRENLDLALNAAAAMGCSIVNIGAADFLKGTPHLVLGILWQIIKIGLVAKINLKNVPGLINLLEEGETMKDLNALSPEELLIRWVNYHLSRSPTERRIKNLNEDIKDSEAYVYLLHQIAPEELESQMSKEHSVLAKTRLATPQQVMFEPDHLERARLTLETADVIKCKAFVTPQDIVDGNPKLNLAFVANLFNYYPALDTPAKEIEEEFIVETREEKTFRNWINSLGLKAGDWSIPFVNNLYHNLASGLVILSIEDRIKPGTVKWNKVSLPPFKPIKAEILQRQNCKYAVEYAGEIKGIRLVGVGGNDIYEQNETLTLGLVWQLMRAYTQGLLSTLSQELRNQADIDAYVINWVNTTLEQAGKTTLIKDFKDKQIATSLCVLDLIDAIKPKSVNYDLVVMDCTEESDKFNNAKLAINLGRRLGARIYALPEDLVEVKHKMVMTVFACLMARGLQTK